MKSSEAFGHCAPCVEFTVQPYRKSVKPEKCHNCICYWAGREDAAGQIAAIDFPQTRMTLGVKAFRDLAVAAARGDEA